MTKSLKTSLSTILLVFLLILQYQNCSQYGGENSFLTDNENSQASIAALEAVQPRLDSPVGVLDLSEYDLTISVGGECNIGNAVKHYLEIQVQDSANVNVPIREDSLCPKDGVNLSVDCYRARQFRCEHGRYSIHLPVNCAAYRNQFQSIYRLKGQLVVTDAKGREVRDAKASFDRFFNISWAPSACK